MEDKDVVDPGDRRDGGPVGADVGVWVLFCKGATGVLPTRPVGHLCKAGCVPPLSVSSQQEFRSPSRMV